MAGQICVFHNSKDVPFLYTYALQLMQLPLGNIFHSFGMHRGRCLKRNQIFILSLLSGLHKRFRGGTFYVHFGQEMKILSSLSHQCT